jgi:hypothetical protein
MGDDGGGVPRGCWILVALLLGAAFLSFFFGYWKFFKHAWGV